MDIDQLGKAILVKTDQMIVSAKCRQRPHVIGQRIHEVKGMLELVKLNGEPELERELQGHFDDLPDYEAAGLVSRFMHLYRYWVQGPANDCRA
jgi:hypothetical protein